jgi:hypothetical protein
MAALPNAEEDLDLLDEVYTRFLQLKIDIDKDIGDLSSFFHFLSESNKFALSKLSTISIFNCKNLV